MTTSTCSEHTTRDRIKSQSGFKSPIALSSLDPHEEKPSPTLPRFPDSAGWTGSRTDSLRFHTFFHTAVLEALTPDTHGSYLHSAHREICTSRPHCWRILANISTSNNMIQSVDCHFYEACARCLQHDA